MTTPDLPGSGPLPDDAASPFDTPSAGPGAGPPPAPGQPPVGQVPPTGGWPPYAGAPQPAPAPGFAPAPAPARTGAQAGIVAGVILVVIGGALLLGRVVEINFGAVTWPLWIVVPGVAMLIASFFIPPKGGVGLAVPGAIVAMVGLILWVQATYGLYPTWAYAWALVAPTGPGLGMLLYGIVQRDGQLVSDGLKTTLVGLGLFLGFGLFFEGVIGLSGTPIANLDQVLPYAIIGLGILLVVLSVLGRGREQGGGAPRPR